MTDALAINEDGSGVISVTDYSVTTTVEVTEAETGVRLRAEPDEHCLIWR
jgi:hypothetical protein